MAGLIPPTKVRQGLTEQFLVAGVEPRLLMLNVGFFLFIFLLFRSIPAVVVTWGLIALLAHMAMKPMSKADPFLRRIYLRYSQQANRYEPWPTDDGARSRRPTDFGMGVNQ